MSNRQPKEDAKTAIGGSGWGTHAQNRSLKDGQNGPTNLQRLPTGQRSAHLNRDYLPCQTGVLRTSVLGNAEAEIMNTLRTTAKSAHRGGAVAQHVAPKLTRIGRDLRHGPEKPRHSEGVMPGRTR